MKNNYKYNTLCDISTHENTTMLVAAEIAIYKISGEIIKGGWMHATGRRHRALKKHFNPSLLATARKYVARKNTQFAAKM